MRKRVLLVEDDKIFRKYVKTILENKPDEFEIAGEAWDGRAGLTMVGQLDPDLLILDIEMPSLDGVELLRELKRLDIRPQILVISCHDEYEYVRQAMKQGAADYLLKHKITKDTLLQAIRQLECLSASEETQEEQGQAMRKEVQKALRYIQENYRHEITLDEVATQVGISRTYFSSIFKKETEEQFSSYLTDFRLERACEMLRKSESKIYNIAYEVGFHSHNYFNNIFKKKYGMTPKEYREKYQKSNKVQ